MTYQELKFEIYALRVGERLFVPDEAFSSGTVLRLVSLMREEHGRRYSTITDPTGTTVIRNGGGS